MKLAHASSLLAKTTCQKQPHKVPGPHYPNRTCGNVSHKLSTPQGGRANPKIFAAKHIWNPLRGRRPIETKNKRENITNPLENPPPSYLAIRAVLWWVSMYASLARTNILNECTNNPTTTSNILTATPTYKVNPKAWTTGSNKHKWNNNGEKNQISLVTV
jgi:hypothetical protein